MVHWAVSLDGFKGIAVASTFLIAMLGGLSPMWGAHSARAARVLPVMNAASAGVFLSGGLMHLLADALSNEALTRRSEEFWGEDDGAGLAALSLCAGGFLLLVMVEQAVVGCADTGDNMPVNAALLDGGPSDSSGGGGGARRPAAALAVTLAVGLGLSVHSVMEGLALGAQQDEAATAGIFFAILAHKGIAAFALGNKTYQSVVVERAGGGSRKTPFVLSMLLFALMTPAGIGVAWGVTSIADSPEESPWPAAFSAVGAGTFLFVATVEVIPSELGHDAADRGLKTAGLVAGAFLMGMLAKWA